MKLPNPKIIGSVCPKHPEMKGERYSQKKRSGILSPAQCPACHAEQMRINGPQQYQKNKAKIDARSLAWARSHKERRALIDKKSLATRLPRKRETSLAWKLANPEMVKRHKRNYYAVRSLARRYGTPKWANLFFIEEAYDLAARRSKATGFQWHVDHIVPMRSKLVCGLHVHNNLQVIPGVENVKKGNHVWPDMP